MTDRAHGDELDDDDALSWEGDERFGRAPDSRAARGPRASETDAEGREPAPAAGGAHGPDDGLDDDERAGDRAGAPARSGGSTAATLGFGLLYLALAVGWILSVQLSAQAAGGILSALLVGFGNFLALIATPVWFAGVVHLTAESRVRVRVGALALGVVVLLPWPVLIGMLP